MTEIETGAPKKLTAGAYGNTTVNISRSCTELPTDVIIKYHNNNA
ncbi:MAG: hypothetical protein V3R68_05605 [Gammaproteobacteria bacterium]